MTRSPRIASHPLPLVLALVTSAAACGSDEVDLGPDSSPPPVLVVDGIFDAHSRFTLTAPPVEAGAMLTALASATDGGDDPSRYLVDLVVAQLPEGTARDVAEFLAPSIAAYVQLKVDAVAPRFVPGVRALAAGLSRLSTDLAFHEMLEVTEGGATVRRTLTALDVGGQIVDLAPVTARARATLTPAGTGAPNDHRLVVDAHAIRLEYGELLRRGFDEAIVPSVVPDALHLGQALAALVDCPRLGGLVAEHIGLGSPSLYSHACVLGLAAAAAELDAHMPRDLAVTLTVEGAARAVDSDRDGDVDTLHGGSWVGEDVRGSFAATRRAER